MNWTPGTAWLSGAALLVLAHVLWWGVASGTDYAQSLRVIIFAIPILAAFVVTYFSPRRKVALGLSMSAVGAVLGMIAMLMYQGLGYHVDQIGGPATTAAVLFAVHVGYATVGTSAGYIAWRVRCGPVSK